MKIQTYQSWWRDTLKLYLQYLGLSLSAVPAYFIVALFVGYNVLDSRPATIAVLVIGSLIGLAAWMMIGSWFSRPVAHDELAALIVPNLDIQGSWSYQIVSTSLAVVALTAITAKSDGAICNVPDKSSIHVQSLN